MAAFNKWLVGRGYAALHHAAKPGVIGNQGKYDARK